MMQALGIIIIVVLFFYLCWPSISRWLKRKAMEKTEDYIRRTMGMPPREKGRKKSSNSYSSGGENGYESFYSRRRQKTSSNSSSEPIIPKEYAEDVEYTETVNYSSSSTTSSRSSKQTYHESQVSDAEWTEIKTSGKHPR